MKSNTLMIPTAALFALALAFAVNAQETAELPPPAEAAVTYGSLDANADGGVTVDEIPADHALAKDFAKADGDGDGKLSQEEFDAYNGGGM